jgi:hypothetical protein
MVSPEQIRERLRAMEQRRRFYEWQVQQPGKLRRHEMWRHQYLAYPYLIGAPDSRVSERFKQVFINVMELGSSGKLQPVPMEQTDEFIKLFTHLLEELDGRGQKPSDPLFASAGAPLARYFEGGTPIGIQMFENYDIPKGAYLVKYGKKEHLEAMYRGGNLRIANANSYKNSGHIDAVRDDETSRTFYLPTYRERIRGETHLDFQGHRIEFGDDDIELPLIFDDYYLFSMCDRIHYRMPTDFNADAALVIKDPERFTRLLAAAFLNQFPSWIAMHGAVTYYDPYLDYSKFKVPHMAKHFAYAYQHEFRIAFRPGVAVTELPPLYLSVGRMDAYADLVALR